MPWYKPSCNEAFWYILCHSAVSAYLPSQSLRNLLTCLVAMSSAENVGKGKPYFLLPCGLWIIIWWTKFPCIDILKCRLCICFLRFLNLKIQEGEAHNIICPASDCHQLVPVEVIESVVSREMDKRYLQFDIKVMMSNFYFFLKKLLVCRFINIDKCKDVAGLKIIKMNKSESIFVFVYTYSLWDYCNSNQHVFTNLFYDHFRFYSILCVYLFFKNNKGVV